MISFRLINCILIAIHFYATYQKLLYDRLSRWFTWNEISIPDDSTSYEILALGTTRSKESLKIVFAIFPTLWWIMAPNNQSEFVYFYQFRHFLLFVAIVPSAQSIPNVPSLPSIPFTPSMPSMPSIPLLSSNYPKATSGAPNPPNRLHYCRFSAPIRLYYPKVTPGPGPLTPNRLHTNHTIRTILTSNS